MRFKKIRAHIRYSGRVAVKIMPRPPPCSCKICGAPARHTEPWTPLDFTDHPDVRDQSDVVQPQRDSQAAGIAQLRAIVEKVALRQDRLIYVVEQHVQHMVGGHPLDMAPGNQAAFPSTPNPGLEVTSPEGMAPPGPTLLRPSPTPKSFSSTGSATGPGKYLIRKSGSWWMKAGIRQEATSRSDEADGFGECDAHAARWVKRIVGTRRFEFFSGSIIFVNMITLFAQLQWQSCDAAFSLGFSADDCGWSNVDFVFDVTEYLFNAWYTGELMLRMYAFRQGFMKDPINVFDLVVVCMVFIQHVFLETLVTGLAPLRLLRLLRSLRIVRVVRLLLVFKELHILLKTLAASFFSLHWSMCLLGVLIWAAGILMMQLLQHYLRDPTQDLETREYLYSAYGTPFRAVFSMFVATFSAQWVPMARETIEHVNPFFACFWVLYIVSVNFAVVRVVSALFLRQTLDVSSSDSERRAMESQKHKAKFAMTLHEIFARADLSEDGFISREEFAAMIKDPVIMSLFGTLDLDEDEVCALFEVMSSDDGCVDYQEFLTGAMKMKGSARTFDVVQILHELGVVNNYLCAVGKRLGVVEHAPDHPVEPVMMERQGKR